MAPKRKRTLTNLWSQLPFDILDSISKRLDLPVDVVSFGGVCKTWRSVALETHKSLYRKLPMHLFVPKRSPLPMLLHPGCHGSNTHHLYSINQGKKYIIRSKELSNKWIVGSGAGWLATVDTNGQEINLLNPLTRKKICLPHLSTIPAYDAMIRVENQTDYGYIKKIIVGHYRGNVLIVALVSLGRTIRFCRMGDSKWTSVEKSPINLNDIIIHNDRLYASNKYGALYEINIAESTKVTMVAVHSHPPSAAACYLVSLCGELVLVTRFFWHCPRNRPDRRTSEFEVFKLVEAESVYTHGYPTEVGTEFSGKVQHSWVPLENLRNHVVFIGYNHSLSLDSRVYPRCKGNRIYFADDRRTDYWRMSGSVKRTYHDVGMCRMKDMAMAPIEYFCNASSRMNMVWLSPSFSNEIEVGMIAQ